MPSWVITEDAARQYELGILKTGKEADVHLVERRLGDRVNLLAAKRFRRPEQRSFKNDAVYRRGRRTGNERIDRIAAKGTATGMRFRFDQWVATEFDILGRLWASGASVPYPVQRSGNEVMLEFIGDDEEAAPRLANVRPARHEIAGLFDQVVDLLTTMARAGVVHADLSAFNLMLWQGRVYAIDFPQAVDLLGDPSGLDLLHRDVGNVCRWFERHGLSRDADALYAELIAAALS